MDNSNGCLGVLMIAGTASSWILSGIVAWDWVRPHGFAEAIGFLLVWTVLGKVFDFVLGLIVVAVAQLFEK